MYKSLINYTAVFLIFLGSSPFSIRAQTPAQACEDSRENSSISQDECISLFTDSPYYSSAIPTELCTQTGPLDLERLLRSFAQQESSNNPLADATPASTASGKYQYINGTWQTVANAYYPPAAQYPRGKDAPEAIQDAVIFLEYYEKSIKFAGDIELMGYSHFLPSAINDPAERDKIPPNNLITPREYSQKLQKGYDQDTGKDVVLYYRDAPEFDFYFTKLKEKLGENATSSAAPSGVNSSCTSNFSGGQSIVAIAKAEVGNKETTPDCGPDIDKYFTDQGINCGAAWCAVFARWVYEKAGYKIDTNTQSAVAVGAWFKENKFFFGPLEPYSPQPGDIYVKRRKISGWSAEKIADPSIGSFGHIGIVVEVDGYKIKTIDGNYGGGVNERVFNDYRTDIPYFVGFGRYVDKSEVTRESIDKTVGVGEVIEDDGGGLSEE